MIRSDHSSLQLYNHCHFPLLYVVIYETRYCDIACKDILVDYVYTALRAKFMYKNALVLGYHHDVFCYAIKTYPRLLPHRNQICNRHRRALG